MGSGVERADAFRAEGDYSLMSPAAASTDPLGEDRSDDPQSSLSDRELARVVFVAAETGHRFAREGRDVDPAAWMYSPRQLFAGARPLEACMTRHGFVAAMLLHGVWHDVDAHPAVIEGLLNGEHGGAPSVGRPLFSAFVSSPDEATPRHGFYATAAADHVEARTRLMLRIGRSAADAAELRSGFDSDDPRARMLLPGILLQFLARMNASAAPEGLEVLVDYRGVE